MYRWLLLGSALLAVAAAPDPAPDEPPAGTEIVHPGDGALMVYVPSGWFVMGVNADEADRLARRLGYKDYHAIAAEEWFPRRRVWLPGYFVDKYEVTLGQWERYAAATKYAPKLAKVAETMARDKSLFPAVNITWAEAQHYANWARKQLPGEAQWEKAARGTDGRTYPWGEAPLSAEYGVFVDLKTNKPTAIQRVGSKPAGASPYGCLDMAGNAYEWTADWFEPYPNNPEAERMLSYTGHQNGVLRGGSFYHADHAYGAAKRFGFRPDETYYHVGFRCVWTPPDGWFKSQAFSDAKAAVAPLKADIDRRRQLP
jgi:formylglycine-generating enzyme required for sulfatase activity